MAKKKKKTTSVSGVTKLSSPRPVRLVRNMLVRFDFDKLPAEFHSQYPFTRKDVFVYLGDIVQMPGHCIVVRTKDNQIFTCYHTDNFLALTGNEV